LLRRTQDMAAQRNQLHSIDGSETDCPRLGGGRKRRISRVRARA